MTIINKTCLFICFYLRFISANVIPKYGVIFFNGGDITISETNLSKPRFIGNVELPKSARLRAVSHGDAFIYLFYTNSQDKKVGAIVIEKESKSVVDHIRFEIGKRVYHMMVKPDNSKMFLDVGDSLDAFDTRSYNSDEIVRFGENFVLIDIFFEKLDNALYYLISGSENEMILYSYNLKTTDKKKFWSVMAPHIFEHALYDSSVRKMFFFIENIIVICPIDNPTFHQKLSKSILTSASMGPGYMIYRTKIEGILYIFNTSSRDDAKSIKDYDHELMKGQIQVYSRLDYSSKMIELKGKDLGVVEISRGCSNPDIIRLTPLLIILHFKFALLHYG